MRFLFYTHSLISDWNHGNAHFLRGVMRNLIQRGHEAVALEPRQSWSRDNLVQEQGDAAANQFQTQFPTLRSVFYDADFEHEAAAAEADVVIVHEWTDPALVQRLGRARREGGFTLLFHDTHHRAVSADTEIAAFDLSDYDGVLVFGEALRERYLAAGWGKNVHTWHEAADDMLFKPLPNVEQRGDLVWVGNWGDDERSAEIRQFLIEPVARLGITATVHGVRYPDEAKAALSEAGIAYKGWVSNADVPLVFARRRLTVHIPRRPYVESLPGIPTIRVFEALACGIPLISAPWEDREGLFRPGEDFLFARDGDEMTSLMRDLLLDHERRESLATSGLETIRARHTCRHRVDELLGILAREGTQTVRRSLREEAAE
jgi:spore maturation protein CgeB